MMITLSKTKSWVVENGKRILTVLQFGAKTAKECGPFGFDSGVPDDWTAVYAETSNKDEPVIVGYINRNQLAELGGSRVYSLGDDGDLAAYLYCRASGVLELNGATYSAVRFQALQSATNAANTLINAELAKISASIGSLGGVYVPGSIATDLTNTESPEVKLK